MKSPSSKSKGDLPVFQVRPPDEAEQLQPLWKRCGGAISDHLHEVFGQHKLHWCFVIAIIGLFLYAGHKLEHHPGTYGMRYRMHRVMQNPWPRPLLFRDTVVVSIDDDAFWHDLRGREPLDRRYLGDLIAKVASCNPAVIAMDVRLEAYKDGEAEAVELKSGRKLLVHPQDAEDHEYLFETMRKTSQKCGLVVPKRVRYAVAAETRSQSSGSHAPKASGATSHGAEEHERPLYARKRDAYDEYGFDHDQITPGYTILYDDSRTIPPTIQMDDGSHLDSFSLAAARQFRPELVQRKDWNVARIASFVVQPQGAEISAHQLMTEPGERWQQDYVDKIKHKIVVIGGNWHKDSHGAGEMRDGWDTPVGELPGAVLHANYIEAILDDRSFDRFSLQWALLAIDGVLGFLLAYVAVLNCSAWFKLPALLVVGVIPLAASLLVLQCLAIYWDVVVLYGMLGLHLVAEKFLPSHSPH